MNEALTNQALRAWSNLKTIVTDMAEGTIPGLTGALKGLNTGLEAARGFLEHHPGVSTAARVRRLCARRPRSVAGAEQDDGMVWWRLRWWCSR
jgi:hypothetical protein